MTGPARRRISRHPKLLWSAAVALLLVWVTLFWVYFEVTNNDTYHATISNGGADVLIEPYDWLCLLAMARLELTPTALLDLEVAGQHVQLGWIRGRWSEGRPYHWTAAFGGWPAIVYDEVWRIWHIRIPLWLPLLIIAFLMWRWYRRHRPQPGICRNCGYNLTGNISGVCPECGTTIEGAKA